MAVMNLVRSTLLQNIKPLTIVLNTTKLDRVSRPLGIFEVQCRNTSFFNKLPAEALWKGVTSVSNAGKKRGRGKGTGRKIAKDLNRGQVIGIGKVNMVWPGLTTPVIRGREIIQQMQLPEDPEREAKILKMRNEMGQFKRIKLLPIDRGWSGNKLPGRRVGPPDPIGEDFFENFDTIVLELKSVFNMTGNLGRKRQISCFVVTGNGQGLAGFGLGKALDGKTALKTAKNRAGQRVMYIERYNNHTICHDFASQFGKTKIIVKKKPEGYGLICHRAIKSICEMIGIKDLYAKVEGSTNLQHIVKAFFVGLLQQKTPDVLANETGYNVVELKEENDFFPQLIAKPSSTVQVPAQKLDFQEHVMKGKVVLQKKKFTPFYKKLPGWELHLKKTLKYRNQDKVRINLLAENGALKSFLSEKEQKKDI
ncbi:small ribosomal subunit protein uS5m [Halyomorpha halys]|uniref:small ribosomal subunit protein uS5m n=1 Tax=Halyomorpha halys TaxID=286706 RepID=UPI0006D51FDD|nr:28S ribosomal protein S5, mitochondrial [Halyomorpha halys]